jgi:hypothetical protein
MPNRVERLTASYGILNLDHLCNGLVSTVTGRCSLWSTSIHSNPQHLVGRRRWLQSLIFEDTEKMQGILASKCVQRPMRPTGDAQRVAHNKRSMSSLDSYITSYHIYILYRFCASIHIYIYIYIYMFISFYVYVIKIYQNYIAIFCVFWEPQPVQLYPNPLSCHRRPARAARSPIRQGAGNEGQVQR